MREERRRKQDDRWKGRLSQQKQRLAGPLYLPVSTHPLFITGVCAVNEGDEVIHALTCNLLLIFSIQAGIRTSFFYVRDRSTTSC